jgi:NADH-quinone oxidoreductase subunit G
MIQAKIDGMPIEVEAGTSILDATRNVNIRIPTLCKHDDLPATAACGLCVVQNRGSEKMLRACCTALEQGMDIVTSTPEIVDVRRSILELILSAHPNDCLRCGRNTNCELQRIAAEFGIRQQHFADVAQDIPRDDSTGAIVLDPAKCIKCGRCLQVCQQMQNVWALSFLERGFNTRMAPAGDILLKDSPCVGCGQCSAHCPTGAAG